MDQIDRLVVQKPLRWRLGLLLLLGSLGCLALLPTGCSPPCPGKCMKFKIKMESSLRETAISPGLNHSVIINLTTKEEPPTKIDQARWTITAPSDIAPEAFFKQTTPGNPLSKTRSYTLQIPGLPENLHIQLTGQEPEAKQEMTGFFLALTLNLGTTWLSKLSGPSGVSIWLNADGFSAGGTIYASAFIHRPDSKCNALQSSGKDKYKLVDLNSTGELAFETWEPGGC